MWYRIDNSNLYVDFNHGIQVYSRGQDRCFYVEVEEYKKNQSSPVIVESYHYYTHPKPNINSEFFLPIQFYFDFEVSVFKTVLDEGIKKIFSHRFNDTSKLVKFVLDTKDFEEAKIWIESVKRYCYIHSCEMVIESKFPHLNNLSNPFYKTKDLLPYKTYRIGRFPKNSNDWRTIDPRKEGWIWFANWKTFWSYEHPRCWKYLTSKEIADDILGLS